MAAACFSLSARVLLGSDHPRVRPQNAGAATSSFLFFLKLKDFLWFSFFFSDMKRIASLCGGEDLFSLSALSWIRAEKYTLIKAHQTQYICVMLSTGRMDLTGTGFNCVLIKVSTRLFSLSLVPALTFDPDKCFFDAVGAEINFLPVNTEVCALMEA